MVYRAVLRQPAHLPRIFQEYQASLFCHNSNFLSPNQASLKSLPLFVSSTSPPQPVDLLSYSYSLCAMGEEAAAFVHVQPPGTYPCAPSGQTPDPSPSQSPPLVLPLLSACSAPLQSQPYKIVFQTHFLHVYMSCSPISPF